MKFPYRQYVVELPGSTDYRLISRPVITIKVSGPADSLSWDALVDTGADETIVPQQFAKALGVNLDECAVGHAVGITGESQIVHFGDVRFQIALDGKMIEWQTLVGFMDTNDEFIILGHGGCLEYFTAVFDGEREELELEPNESLPLVQD